MKFVILTYKEAIPLAQETQAVLKKDWDIDADIIVGYTIGQLYKKNHVICHGFKDKILNIYDEDIYYLEDDVRFTHNPLDIDLTKDIV